MCTNHDPVSFSSSFHLCSHYVQEENVTFHQIEIIYGIELVALFIKINLTWNSVMKVNVGLTFTISRHGDMDYAFLSDGNIINTLLKFQQIETETWRM